MNYYLEAWRRYAEFSGRSTRTEFWLFTLFNFLIALALYLIGLKLNFVLILYVLYMLALIVPSLAITVRRLHDTSRSGWWWFIQFVPIAGPIILLVFMCLPSTPSENQYD